MSYEIIKKIQIHDNKVYVTGASNNVYPRTPKEWECHMISKILQEKGQEEAEIEILRAYEEGNFQGGNNKYTRALQVLVHLPEYKRFDWRGDFKYAHANKKNFENEYKEVLKKALNTRLPKEKYIITKFNGAGQKLYFLHRKRSHFCTWSIDKLDAKLFNFSDDAEFTKKGFINSDSWQVETA